MAQDPEHSKVTASEVVDRETLKTFVKAATRIYRETMLGSYSKITHVKNAFRTEGSDWKSGSSRRSNRSFHRAQTPKSNNMATQKPSRCPAMRPSEPSEDRGGEHGKKPAAIIDDLSSKPTSDAIKKYSAVRYAPAPSLTNRPKPGSAVPCSTGCYNALNPNRIP